MMVEKCNGLFNNYTKFVKNCSAYFTFFSHSAVDYNTLPKHVGACVSLSKSIVTCYQYVKN